MLGARPGADVAVVRVGKKEAQVATGGADGAVRLRWFSSLALRCRARLSNRPVTHCC